MQATSKVAVCPVRYCGRLVHAALPLLTRSLPVFDTKTYCSHRCAQLHVRGKCRALTSALITCDVCCEERLLTDYIHKSTKNGATTETWNCPVPEGCLPHLAPEFLNFERGTCIFCLRTHIAIQLETRGAANVSCIETHRSSADSYTPEQFLLTLSQDWLPYAHHFLSPDQREIYHQQLLESFMYTSGTTFWTCPTDCGYSIGVLQPNETPGFPHVECSGCLGRFCANCKVPWHPEQTCQQYRIEHPELRDEGEVEHLREMARLGARRCPRCQFIIIKEGGCNHVFCEQCHFNFSWPQAELVIAPPELHLPVVHNSTSSAAFRGQSELRQAQEEYVPRPGLTDTPSRIGSSAPSPTKDVFFFHYDTYHWYPEPCELEAVVHVAAGGHYIRSPSHDRDNLVAFIAVAGGEDGGSSLSEALRLYLEAEDQTENEPLPAAIRPGHFPVPINEIPTMQQLDVTFEGLQAVERRLADELDALVAATVALHPLPTLPSSLPGDLRET